MLIIDKLAYCRCSFVPESFRWLACNGRIDDAEKEIRYVAKINRKPAPSIKLLQSVVGNGDKAPKFMINVMTLILI